MNMRDEIAEILEQDLKGPSLQALYATADAIVTALPDMIAPLVWVNNPSHLYFVYYNLDKDFCGYNFSTEDIVEDGGFSLYLGEIQTSDELFCTVAEAKAAANAHHVAQIMAAFNQPKEPT